MADTKNVRSCKLRASITPGTVLILLAGRFRGKRVVFLKQLESGLLLVTGPFCLNGVPLRRVDQAYVIATSTKLDLSGVEVNAKINDSWFKRSKDAKSAEQQFFGDSDGKQKKLLPAELIQTQKKLDRELVASITKTPLLLSYLKCSFSLKKGQSPHLMKF
ncbi:60S ribosomal protein L6 [Dimargaris verticillata]|uniref:60S ribosomal protein L6 n=1 Tax=Dimargaris verticillata TaxID=2761393 RepID=A0A9W8AYX7_9FUNG|nr:60S ribosomal protein L6 [Dimargaris verticillata]